MIGLLLLLFAQVTEPAGPVTVSRETTYVTRPLKADGTPDYERYFLETCRQGVTPENNAAVPLFEAMWPGALEPPQYEAVAHELGLPHVPSKTGTLQDVRDEVVQQRVLQWMQAHGKPQGTLDDVAISVDRVTHWPWSSQMMPPLADWVRENQKPLDTIVAASQRPRFYPPSPTLLNDEDEGLIEMLVPGVQAAREAVRGLAVRAMWNLGEGRLDDAWQDILAVHRWARLVGQGHTVIEQVVALSINHMACEATAALLDAPQLTQAQVRNMQRDLDQLSGISGVVDAFDTGERAMFLDRVLRLRAGKDTGWHESLGVDDAFKKQMVIFTRLPAEWDIALRQGNKYFDLAVAAARLQPGVAREQAIAKLAAYASENEQVAKRGWGASLVVKSPKERGEVFAAVAILFFPPVADRVIAMQDDANAELGLARLAAALALYRIEHGAYPDKLAQLVPAVLRKLPVDFISGQPPIFRREGDGCLLYSVGENGVDDGGSNARQNVVAGYKLRELSAAQADGLRGQIREDADDIAIRLRGR